jgi:hypothetical protein
MSTSLPLLQQFFRRFFFSLQRRNSEEKLIAEEGQRLEAILS